MESKELIQVFVEMVIDIAEHKATKDNSKEDIIQAAIDALQDTLTL